MTNTQTLFEYKFSAMGSPCSLNLYCQSNEQFLDISSTCEKEVIRLENKYSRYKSDSFLSLINNHAGTDKAIHLDRETLYLMEYANTAFNVSDGLFDITSGILRRVWDFKNNTPPNVKQIEEVLTLVGWDKLKLHDEKCLLPQKEMELDFGGIVKEYAADKVSEIASSLGVTSGLVDLGGDISIVGPHPDHSPWLISISNPKSPNEAIATIPLMSGGLASSGDYQRFIILNGERYSHILNPKTGWPVKGLSAVSVWAPKCVIAGTIATTAMLKEESEGIEWLKETGCDFFAVNINNEAISNNTI